MPLVLTMKYEGPVPGNMTKREFNNEILKPSWHAVGKYHHRKHMPKRFTGWLRRQSYYTYRKGEEPGFPFHRLKKTYTGRKMRQKGHRDPLVWSGETRASAKKMAGIAATSKGVKLRYFTPKLNYRHPNSQVRAADEFRQVPESEYPALIRVFDKAIQGNLRAYRKQKTETP